MNTFVARLLVVLAALTALGLVGCETHTCRSACTKVFDECGRQSDGCSTSGTNIDCTEPGAWEEHQKSACISDCEDALYTLAGDTDTDDEATNISTFENEEDATQFIECVVNTDCTTLLTGNDCNIRW